ncbi:MAG: electron transfer flavoprotein subunit beta/FixA family protein [Lachnospiraceae bacterium]|nr:electron transfer flavoprotein subunit beta/FixA family protein [Lachnospiraceae bacterium]
MNILVCVKQVPDTTEIKIDPVTNTLIRAGVPSIVNPYDGYALEVGLRIKDAVGGTVTVLCMGPEQAKEALKTCLAIGADKAWLLTDRLFGGSDTLATSYILSRAVKKLEEEAPFDLILCGKQAIDGDTAQVGPELAEHLGRPQVTCVIELTADGDVVRGKRESDMGYDIIECATPALVTVTKTPFEPRFPTIRSRLAATRAEIPSITAADLDLDLAHCGLKGSPTKVKKTFTPSRNKNVQMLQADSPSAVAAQLLDALRRDNVA